MTTQNQLPDPDVWLGQKKAQALPDPETWLHQKQAPALPDPDAWMQRKATSQVQPAAPATFPQPRMILSTGGPFGRPIQRPYAAEADQPKLTLKEAMQQTKEVLNTPMVPLTKVTEPLSRAIAAAPYGVYSPVPSSVLAPVVKATGGFVEDMTRPTSLAMMAAVGPLMSADLGVPGLINSVAFAADATHRAYQRWQASKQAEQAGDSMGAEAEKIGAVGDLVMGVLPVLHWGTHGPSGADYQRGVDLIRQGINSPHLDAESLSTITQRIEEHPGLAPEDKAHLLAVADARAEQMAKQVPPVAGVRPQVEPPAPGTLATGPFPGPQARPIPTIREQMRAPSQAPLPATEAAGPTQPLPALPELAPRTQSAQVARPQAPEPAAGPPPAWEQTVTQPRAATVPALPIYSRPPVTEPLPGLNMPRATVDPDAPMLDIQRRVIFGIADSKGVPKEALEQVAGKRISQLTVADARQIIAKLNSLTPEDAQALRPKATTPLLDQVNAAQAGEAEGSTASRTTPVTQATGQPATPNLAQPGEAPLNTVVFGKQRKAPQYDPDVSLVNAIRSLGGINPDKIRKSGLWTEWTERVPQGIRLALQRKDATHGLDTVGAELAHLGYQGYDTGDSIVEALHDPRKANAGTRDIAEASELEHANAYIADLERRLKETEFNPEELATAGQEPGRIIREPGEEGFARFRDDRTKDLFEPEDFALIGGPGRRAELPEQKPAVAMPSERPQQLAMGAGPLFEKAPAAEGASPSEQAGMSAAKEPWQMTQEEYAESKGVLKSWETLRKEAEQAGGKIQATYGIDSSFGKRGDPISLSFDSSDYWSKPVVTNERTGKSVRLMNALPYQVLTTEHQGFVKDALAEGKPVPTEALKNYPDLQRGPIEAGAGSPAEDVRQQAEKVGPVRPVSEAAGQFAQMEVDRRAQVAAEAVDRVLNGKGSWSDKRRMLGLENVGRYDIQRFPEVPISKYERQSLLDRMMKETTDTTGLTPTGAQTPIDLPKPKTRSLFGDDEGFLRFKNRPLVDDDPQMKQIFDRLEQAEKNARRPAFDILPRPGEADVPNSDTHRVSWIRSADQALARYEDTAPVAREIKTAARDKKAAMQRYDDIASDIVKESKIKKGSEEDRMVKDLLDESYTRLTPEKLLDSIAYQGNKEAAIKAAGRLRNEIFDPIINQIRGDPELTDIIGKRGYIRGYFPHYEQMMKAKYGPDYMGMVRALLPERFMSAFLKERTGDRWANDVSIYDVIPAYINSTMKTIHDIPAYNRAGEVIKALPEGPAKKFAQWYADNYMGQPSAREGFMVNNAPYQAFSRWVAQRYYDNLIGLNPNTWLKQLGKTMINTYPELGAKYTWEGIKGMFDPAKRQQFHDTGLLFDHPGMEAGILKEGMRRSILHGGTAAAQYVDRGIAYLGGLAQAKDMGLVGRAAEMHAMDITDKVAFAYGKESGIRYIQNLPPDWRVFQTWPAKEFEFVRNLVSDAMSGGRLEKARLTRFLMVNIGVPAALTAAGVPTGKVFVDLFHILPRPFRSAQLMMRCYNWLQGVADGKIKPENIPSDIVSGLWDAFGPAANILKQVFGKSSSRANTTKTSARKESAGAPPPLSIGRLMNPKAGSNYSYHGSEPTTIADLMSPSD